MEKKRFQDRREVGKLLARKLQASLRDQEAVVLAIPPGGVPVAFEIASRLHLPLDVLVVRNLCIPGFEDGALGALATGDVCVFAPLGQERLTFAPEKIQQLIAHHHQEIQRCEKHYREYCPKQDIRDRTVILVDDGSATSEMVHAAVGALRKQQAVHIIMAIPVAPHSMYEAWRNEGIELVSLVEQDVFHEPGSCSVQFEPITDEEGRHLLIQSTVGLAGPSLDVSQAAALALPNRVQL